MIGTLALFLTTQRRPDVGFNCLSPRLPGRYSIVAWNVQLEINRATGSARADFASADAFHIDILRIL